MPGIIWMNLLDLKILNLGRHMYQTYLNYYSLQVVRLSLPLRLAISLVFLEILLEWEEPSKCP